MLTGANNRRGAGQQAIMSCQLLCCPQNKYAAFNREQKMPEITLWERTEYKSVYASTTDAYIIPRA